MRRREFSVTAVCASIGSWWPLHASSALAEESIASTSRPVADADAYVGMHFHRLVPGPGNRTPTAWPTARIGSLRLWDSETRWADLSPRRDRWDFDRLDGYVDSAESHGATVLYTFGSPPRWAAERPDEIGPYGPGSASPPASMADWRDYVERIVSRYSGRIAAYEVWNEPTFSDFAPDRAHPAFFTGSVEQMVELTRIARAVIDENDRRALLATPAFVNGPHRLELFLARGGASLVDVVAYHFYASGSLEFNSQISDVRKVMARAGVARLPLWNSECGLEASAVLGGTDLAADRIAQFLLLGAARRLERFYYYAWDNDLTGMVDREGHANARAEAFGIVTRWLSDTTVKSVQSLPGGGYRIDGARGRDRLVFAWSDKGEPFAPTVPIGFRVDSIERLRGRISVAGSTTSLTSTPVAYTLRPIRVAPA